MKSKSGCPRVCACVCVYVHAHVHLHVYMCMCMCCSMGMHAYMYMCMCLCKCMCICACACVLCTCACACACTCAVKNRPKDRTFFKRFLIYFGPILLHFGGLLPRGPSRQLQNRIAADLSNFQLQKKLEAPK